MQRPGKGLLSCRYGSPKSEAMVPYKLFHKPKGHQEFSSCIAADRLFQTSTTPKLEIMRKERKKNKKERKKGKIKKEYGNIALLLLKAIQCPSKLPQVTIFNSPSSVGFGEAISPNA